MPDNLTPCGVKPTLGHFKTCEHEGCKARYADFLKAKEQTQNLFRRFARKDVTRDAA